MHSLRAKLLSWMLLVAAAMALPVAIWAVSGSERADVSASRAASFARLEPSAEVAAEFEAAIGELEAIDQRARRLAGITIVAVAGVVVFWKYTVPPLISVEVPETL